MPTGFSEQCPGKLKRYIESKMNENLKELGISSAYVPYLMALYIKEGTSLKELTEFIGMDRAHTTRMMAKLIEKGLAENTGGNNRQYCARLTDKGKEMVRTIKSETSSINNELLSCLSPEERTQWETIWCKINERIDG